LNCEKPAILAVTVSIWDFDWWGSARKVERWGTVKWDDRRPGVGGPGRLDGNEGAG